MLPKYIKSVLWSYDTDKIDLVKHRRLIISQVLNFGTKEATDWLFKKYSKKNIISELINPKRGVWYPRILNYWQKKLNITIPSEKYKNAIMSLYDINNNKKDAPRL